MFANFINERLPLGFVSSIDFYLDQFVMRQGGVDFCQDVFRQARIADNYHRFQMVGQFTQMTAMGFR